MKNTISAMTIDAFVEKLSNTTSHNKVCVVKNEDIVDATPMDINSVSSMSISRFKKLVTENMENALGRPLKSSDIEVVNASEMNYSNFATDIVTNDITKINVVKRAKFR